MAEIDFSKIEKKWQEKWEKAKCFSAKEKKASSDFKKSEGHKKKYYVVEMYPYPSGSGLHIGHAFNYTIGDICARFKLMQGFNVLHPMGFDSFGLPAENAAIKNKSHPKKFTEEAIAMFIRQQKSLGLTYDWDRMIMSHSPEYYKWDQWIFLQMYKKGLAYKKKASVNWCPKCNGVLANEQVHDGKCWIHKDSSVEIKHLEQWFLKITDYADELYEGVDKLANWPFRIRAMQKNWIGKSHGSEIDFEIQNPKTRIIFVHGLHADLNKKSWYSWLKEELISKGIEINMPQLPSPDHPDLNEWLKEINKLNPDENTILIGHSRGAVSILRYLESLKENKRIKKVILIAGRKGNSNKKSEGFYTKEGYDFEKIKEHCEDFVVFHSDDDPIVPFKDGLVNAEKLNARLEELKDKGHFDKDLHEFPELLNEISEKWPIFTTRADTIYGVTFMVVSAQHPRLMGIVTSSQKREVEDFLKKIKSTSEKDMEELDKEGAFTGSYAINPLTKEKIPVYCGNFVVADYGCGMVMAVPAHDERDFQFAKKYNIPIKVVIQPDAFELNPEKMSRAYTGDGRLVNSREFNSWSNREAIGGITEFLEKKKLGRKTVNFKLRDWLISRQRFWGTPIPVIYCDKCGIQTVPEKDLPVILPENIKFTSQKNPLVDNKKFIEAKCPKCKGKAKRETDTMDTFVNSSWYFFRYCDSHNKKEIFDKKKAEYWMPMDQYIGGAEHACMHLIYSRFYTRFLRDLGMTKLSEPTMNLFNQGMVHAEDGFVMSKSRGNVVDPLDMIKKYSADTLRIFLVSIASPDNDYSWSNTGIESMHKFIKRFVDFYSSVKFGKSSTRVESKMNKAIKEITVDIEEFKYNMAVIKIRALLEVLISEEKIGKKDLESYLKLISPFCPHITEELWWKLGNNKASLSDKSDKNSRIANKSRGFISLSEWPVCDEKKIDMKLEKQEELNENLVRDIGNILRIVKEKQGKDVTKVYVYCIPNEVEGYNSDFIKKRINLDVKIFSAGDKEKYDPSGISKKAKPGKPGIFVE
jgi:leucyl-tRNA synthetase